ncbi:MAG TPA: UDP-N-acetylmuramate--L-alanine ligase [Acidimicrobiia bacterium]|nr:UDP-N-acetylmuramate--L-alanine ligase [Acidimicrobiia bacterium]
MTELPHRIHIVGVGGAGMSALAKMLAGLGHEVTGSDQRGGADIAQLSDIGLDVWQGHDPEAATRAELVVASSAVPDTDPELRAATAAGVTVWRRPDLLRSLSAKFATIGPTGTHGKTTTTAMMIWALRAAGVDPSFVVGGELAGFGTNAHLGNDDLLVLEVDEAFGTFEHIHLEGLVVTNVEADHMDHFGSPDSIEESFIRVVENVTGPVLLCADDPGSRRVAERTGAPTYGTDPAATWRITDLTARGATSRFTLLGPKGRAEVSIPRPGIHVARNAAGALSLLAELGHDLEQAASGLAGFAGVRRRFETRGRVGGVWIIDDYAHHPTEVAATLREAGQYGSNRVWAVFQPHLYSRTLDLHREFGAALALADGIVVTDIYGSREQPMPGVTGRLVAEAAERAGASPVHYVPHRAEVAVHLLDLVHPGDAVVVMGAGDVTLVATELAAALEGHHQPLITPEARP